ncbi:hypothetical protein GQ55_3G130500 [Panicum hallii var. hallii]|uniref:Uncharacterized protein n=1 Tax=Panicum hallii var. hallii TaxID=1504633 RepID=A0A2T7E8W2_9POAL|nr:hypothetical protein GQ55_3G130500 [Panicum hallii var. hallii]
MPSLFQLEDCYRTHNLADIFFSQSFVLSLLEWMKLDHSNSFQCRVVPSFIVLFPTCNTSVYCTKERAKKIA